MLLYCGAIGTEIFEELRNVVVEENGEDKIEKVTNEVLERIGEKKTLLNNILNRKANWKEEIASFMMPLKHR